MFTVDTFLFSVLFKTLVLTGMFSQSSGQGGTIPPPNPQRCVQISSSICSNVQWNGTLPNFLAMNIQARVDEELEPYINLYATGCSNAMLHFICAVYYPPCFQDDSGPVQSYPPCRQLCEYVRCTCDDDIERLGAEWPPQLDCALFDFGRDERNCFFAGTSAYNELLEVELPRIQGAEYPDQVQKCGVNGTTPTPNSTITGPSSTVPPTARPLGCVVRLLDVTNKTSGYERYRLGDRQYCGMRCEGEMLYGEDASTFHVMIPIVILIMACTGMILSLFTIATFLIDRRRFPYPERPMVYLSISYFMLAVTFILGSAAKLAGFNTACTPAVDRSESFVFQELPHLIDDLTSNRSNTCVAIAVFLYYATMTSMSWWVVLAFTWFLAAVLKWAEEAVSKFWLLYHALAWGIPLLQLIILLSLHKIDGEMLGGICYVGNFDVLANALGVFIVGSIYVTVAVVLTILSIIAMLLIRHQMPQNDMERRSKVTRLTLRLGVFSAAVTVPNVILLFLYIYQLAVQESWEVQVLCAPGTADSSLESLRECEGTTDANKPTVAFLFIKYLLWVGLCSSSFIWVISKKTLYSWKRLVTDIFGGMVGKKSNDQL